MNTLSYAKVVSSLKRQRRFLALISSGLVAANLCLVAAIATKEKGVILVPMGLRSEASIANNYISDEYLEVIARDFIQTFLNITPKNEEYVTDYILKLSHPSYYIELKEQLQELFEDIKSKEIKIRFETESVVIDGDNLIAEVAGSIQKSVETKIVEESQKKYHLKFKQEGLKISLIEFYEVGDDKKSN